MSGDQRGKDVSPDQFAAAKVASDHAEFCAARKGVGSQSPPATEAAAAEGETAAEAKARKKAEAKAKKDAAENS